jgi:hypothetical protein
VTKERSRDTLGPGEETEKHWDQGKQQRHTGTRGRSRDTLGPRKEPETHWDQGKKQEAMEIIWATSLIRGTEKGTGYKFLDTKL